MKFKLHKLTIKYIIMLLQFTVIYVLESIYTHYFCLVGLLYNGVRLHISSNFVFILVA